MEPPPYPTSPRILLILTAILLITPSLHAGTQFVIMGQDGFLNGSLDGLDPDGSPGDLKLGTRNHSDSSLVGYWRLNDAVSGSGGAVTDYSGNGNHGTTSGGVTTGVEGVRGGKAMSFDGSDDHVDLGAIDIGSDEVTGAAWIKVDSFTASRMSVIVFDEHLSGESEQFIMSVYEDRYQTWISDDGNWIDLRGGDPVADKWIHYAVTYDGNTRKIYINGEVIASDHLDAYIGSPDPNKTTIGARSSEDQHFFNGTISDVRVYRRALSEEEIQQLYDPSPGTFTSQLIDGGGAQWLNLSWQETLEQNTNLEARVHTVNQVNVTSSFNEWTKGTGFWKYRKPITVTEQSGKGLTDYPVEVTVDTATLISNGKLQDDCDDIRFWSPTGGELDYWIQRGSGRGSPDTCNTANTRMYVELESIPASGSKTIYMYYGNDAAASQSDGEATFIQFDNFDNEALDSEWTWTTEQDGYDEGQNITDMLFVDHDNSKDTSVYQADMGDTNFAVGVYNEFYDNGDSGKRHGGPGVYQDTDDWIGCAVTGGGPWDQTKVHMDAGTNDETDAGQSFSTSKVYQEIRKVGDTFECWVKTDTDASWQAGGSGATDSVAFSAHHPSLWGDDWARVFDNFYVRKYTEPEPTYSIGSEEQLGSSQSIGNSVYLSRWFTGTKNWANWQTTGGQPLKPVSQWKMDAGSGQIAADYVGGNNGTLGGSTSSESSDPAWTDACRYDDCLEFDGNDDWVDVPGSTVPPTEEITVTFWQKGVGQPRQDSTFEAVDSAGNRVMNAHIPWDNGKIYWDFGDNSFDRISTSLPSKYYTGWHHYALVADNQTQRMAIYVDGELLYSESHAKALTSSPSQFSIGSYAGGSSRNFSGYIDDFRIYNRSLSAEEIQAFYHSPSQSWKPTSLQVRASQFNHSTRDLVGSWSFEGTGQSVADTSGNSNTGTLGPDASKGSQDAQRGSGYSGQGMIFPGSGEYVEVPDFQQEVSEASWSFWAKPAASTSGRFLYSSVNASDKDGMRTYGGTDDPLAFRIKDETSSNYFQITANQDMAPNEWLHIVETYNGTHAKMYFNGKEVAATTTALVSSFTIGTEPWIGHAAPQWSSWNGSIDEVKVYTRALSQADVQALYNLSEFTDSLTQEQGQYFDTPNTNNKGQTFEENFYQYKINLLTGDSASIPQVEKVVMANASGWSSWLTDPSGNSLSVPDNRYGQVQFNVTSDAVLNTSVLHQLKLTANFVPKVTEQQTITNSSDQHQFTTEAVAMDEDGDSDISSCTVNYNSPSGSGSFSGSLNRSYGNSTEAKCTGTVHKDLSNINVSDSVDVDITFTDSLSETDTTTTVSNPLPNRDTTIASTTSFANYTTKHSFNVTAVGSDVDAASSEISSCTVIHNSSSESYTTAGTLDTSYGGKDEAECLVTIDAEAEGGFDGYEPSEQISVTVRFTDKHGATVETVQTSNIIPNQQPRIHPPVRTFPSAPEFGDTVEVQANTSDQDDGIRWANFTIWERNEDTASRLIHNENGTLTRNGTYALYNSSSFDTDLEAGTYNLSLTVSDGYTTTTRTDTLFTLKAVSPNVSDATLVRPDPWGLAKTAYRPGQTLQAWFSVQDLNGRSDLQDWTAEISGPSTTETIESIDIENEVLNGYNLSVFYTLPDSAGDGDWNLDITATDQDGLSSTNRTGFAVEQYSTVTADLNYTATFDEVTIDGTEQSPGTYDSLEFPYIIETDGPLMTGLIDYGRFEELGYHETSNRTVFNLTQDFTDNIVLVPASVGETSDLEQLEGEFTDGIFSGRGFLDNPEASIAYGITEEKTVRLKAEPEDPDIDLVGFNGSLGTGYHDIAIRNTGTENGTTTIRVIR